MGVITTKEAVIDFLRKMKECINDGRYSFDLEGGKAYTLSQLGLGGK